MKKIKHDKFIVTLIALIAFCAAILINCTVSAHAFDRYDELPVYGLYCENERTILSEEVKFDLNEERVLLQYELAGLNEETSLCLPFISNCVDLVPPAVYVNEQQVNGEISYGKYIYSFYGKDEAKTAFDDVYSAAALDENLTGTLYTVYPDESQFTVNILRHSGQSLVADHTNSYTSRQKNGKTEYTFDNATPNTILYFYFIGEYFEDNFSCDCKFERETITCKQYVDKFYEEFEEYYKNCGNPPKEFFYSQMAALWDDKGKTTLSRLFFDSYEELKINTLNFTVSGNENISIRISAPVRVGFNANYSPYVYGIKYFNVQNRPVKISVQLSESRPLRARLQFIFKISRQRMYRFDRRKFLF